MENVMPLRILPGPQAVFFSSFTSQTYVYISAPATCPNHCTSFAWLFYHALNTLFKFRSPSLRNTMQYCLVLNFFFFLFYILRLWHASQHHFLIFYSFIVCVTVHTGKYQRLGITSSIQLHRLSRPWRWIKHMPPKRQYSDQTTTKLQKVKNNCHDNLKTLFKIIYYRNAPSFWRLHMSEHGETNMKVALTSRKFCAYNK